MRNVRKTRSHAQRKSSKIYEGMNLTRKRLTFSMTFASSWFDTFYAVICLSSRMNCHWWKCWKMVLDAFYLSKKRHRTSFEGRRKWLYKMFLTNALLRRYHTNSKLFSPAKWKTSHYRQTFHCMKKLRNSFKPYGKPIKNALHSVLQPIRTLKMFSEYETVRSSRKKS